jgi:hypothetical protein
MKTAKTPTGQIIEASPDAPKVAICPYCGGKLTLRSRRPMNNGKVTYFWRHRGNKNVNCTARKRPVG